MVKIGHLMTGAAFAGLVLAPAFAQAADMKHVGVGILVTISPTTTALQGAQDELKKEGWVEGKNITYETQNAQNDFPTMRQIGQKFANENLDLILAFGTVVSQNMYAATKTTPIVFSTVSDPIGAKLADSLDHPGHNLSGSRLFPDFHAIVGLITQIQPNAKKIGTIYTTAEPNSVAQVAVLKQELESRGMTLNGKVALNSNDVLGAAQALVGQCDALLLIQDNNSVSNIATVTKVASDAKLPLYASDTDAAQHGPIASIGANVYQIGVAAGTVAGKVLKGQKVGDIPIVQVPATDIVVNESAAAKMGVKIPADIVAKAAVKVPG